jgi:hypothetical protein
MNKLTSILLLSTLGLVGCKSSDSETSSRSNLTPVQAKKYNECMESSPTEYAQDKLHCSIYAATNEEVLQGTTKVLNENYIKSWHKKIKTGDTCNVTIIAGQSNFFGILNGTDYFVRMTANADDSDWGSRLDEPFRTFNMNFYGILDKRLKAMGYWIKYDKDFKITAIGKDSENDDPARNVRKGDPIWECQITGKSIINK